MAATALAVAVVLAGLEAVVVGRQRAVRDHVTGLPRVAVLRSIGAAARAAKRAARRDDPGSVARRTLDAEIRRARVTDPAQVAYILATADHESFNGSVMAEATLGSSTDQRAYFDAQYAWRTDLGNRPGSDDGYRYRGRGYAQLTGRANYAYWSKRLGVDLLGDPDRAANPKIAAKILVLGMRDGAFTGARLRDYIRPGRRDFLDARRVINGTKAARAVAVRAAHLLASIERHDAAGLLASR